MGLGSGIPEFRVDGFIGLGLWDLRRGALQSLLQKEFRD